MAFLNRSRPAVRVELTRSALARRGLVTLVVLALVLGLLTLWSRGALGGPAEVYADVADAGGSLASGADVKMRGVIIGSVDQVARGPEGGVRITVAMRDGALGHVPGDVRGRILPATVFGTSYLDLTVPRPGARPAAAPLRAGAVIPPDTSQHTLELQQALDDLDGLVKALHPAQLNVTLSSLAMALDGRGAQLGRLIDEADSLLRKIGPDVPLIRADLTKLASNLDLLRDVAPDLFDGIRDVLPTLRTVTARREALRQLLVGGRLTTDDAERLLLRVAPDLVPFLHNAVIVGDVYADLRHQAFTDSFATLRELRAKLATVVRHGWIDNTLLIQGDAPPYYTPADCPRFGAARGDNCPGGGR